jgi:hypothetical protein
MTKKSRFNIFVVAAVALGTHFMLRPERAGRSDGFEQRKADLEFAADGLFGKEDDLLAGPPIATVELVNPTAGARTVLRSPSGLRHAHSPEPAQTAGAHQGTSRQLQARMQGPAPIRMIDHLEFTMRQTLLSPVDAAAWKMACAEFNQVLETTRATP